MADNKSSPRTPAPRQDTNTARRSEKLQRFYVELEQRTDVIAKNLMGTGVDVAFFKQVALTAARETKDLLDCEPQSVWSAIYKAARDGLLPDGRDGKIIVRKQNRKGGGETYVAGWQDMFGGLKKKIRRCKDVLVFKAEVVYQSDQFRYRMGDDDFIEHFPSLAPDRGPIVAAYAIAKLANGETLREVMPIHEIRAIRDKFSDGWKAYSAKTIKDTPWATSEGEMAKKTVGRRLAKWLPMDTDLRLSVEHDDDDVLPDSGSSPPIEGERRPQISDFTVMEPVGDDADVIDGVAKEVADTKADAAHQRDVPAETHQGASPTKSDEAPAKEAAAKKPSHAEVVADLNARLSKYPRDVRAEIYECEILPMETTFTAEEIAEFKRLLNGEQDG